MRSRRYLTVDDAAAYLRVSRDHLAKLRSCGGGPIFARVGARRVVYRIEDLDRWVEGSREKSVGVPVPLDEANQAQPVSQNGTEA